MANNIVATWGFKRKLPEPFEDYTDHAIFDDIASKYCTQPRKKSTLHAATLRAVLAYLELENPVGSTPPEKLGDRKSTRLNSSHTQKSRMPSSA